MKSDEVETKERRNEDHKTYFFGTRVRVGGGFIGGYTLAYVFSRSQEREGIGAYLAGGLCMLATVGAFVMQFITMVGMR